MGNGLIVEFLDGVDDSICFRVDDEAADATGLSVIGSSAACLRTLLMETREGDSYDPYGFAGLLDVREDSGMRTNTVSISPFCANRTNLLWADISSSILDSPYVVC